MTSEIAKTYEPPASQDRVLQQPFVHPVVMVGKRSVDVVGAGSLLIAALPLFPLIALAIRMESPGPVLFQQLRVGRTTDSFSELFQMNKFRSMRSDAESRSGAVWATKNDNRITRVGKFLRKTRLDELPQLINVLRGEMSLGGRGRSDRASVASWSRRSRSTLSAPGGCVPALPAGHKSTRVTTRRSTM